MTSAEAIKELKKMIPFQYEGGAYKQALQMAVQALQSNHLCTFCANNKEGVCETQDLISCKHYKEIGK